jgi:phosphate transport system permease protein
MTAAEIGVPHAVQTPARPRAVTRPKRSTRTTRAIRLAPPGLLLGASILAFGLGIACLLSITLEWLTLPVLGALAICSLLLISAVFGETRRLDAPLICLLGACLLCAAILGGLPGYFGVPGLKAIFNHSAVSAPLLLMLAVPCACAALYHLLGGTPHADDLSRYPLVLVPVLLALAVYLAVGMNLVESGVQQLAQPDPVDGSPGWTVFFHEFVNPNLPPYVRRAGLQNQVLGTGLLVLLTMLIALPIGVASGVFVAEIGGDRFARLVQVATSALRGMSVFLLALLATTLVKAAAGTPLAPFIDGYSIDVNGNLHLMHGSYLTAALVTALLIVPVVARATEEGCRSLPRGIREGSAALGATNDYTLVHLTLPWAIPNILTAALLGCAEAAGCVAILFFIAGTGETGVGPFNEVTSLAFSVFAAQFSPDKPVRDLNRPYQYAAGLALLLIALALTAAALLVKRRYSARYRGA